MNRRTFLGTLTGGLLAAPLVAEAQESTKVARVGILGAGPTPSPEDLAKSVATNPLWLSMRQLGWVYGENMIVERRFGESTAELRAGAAVTCELLKEISGKSDLHILAHELRCAPVDMKVDAVLVLQVRVDEVVRQAPDDGKFVSGLWIEIGVADTAVQRHKTKTEIGKARMIVSTTRDISGEIDHGVVNALISPAGCRGTPPA